MTALFEKSDVSFSYPENWKIEESEDDAADILVTVYSPDTAFWTLSVYRGLRDIPQILDTVVGAMRTEYPDLEAEPAGGEIGGVSYRGYDISFICLDLTNTARVRVLHLRNSTYLLLGQAEDRELQSAGPIFDAMAASLVGEVG